MYDICENFQKNAKFSTDKKSRKARQRKYFSEKNNDKTKPERVILKTRDKKGCGDFHYII